IAPADRNASASDPDAARYVNASSADADCDRHSSAPAYLPVTAYSSGAELPPPADRYSPYAQRPVIRVVRMDGIDDDRDEGVASPLKTPPPRCPTRHRGAGWGTQRASTPSDAIPA